MRTALCQTCQPVDAHTEVDRAAVDALAAVNTAAVDAPLHSNAVIDI
jgi:hypothetical protein